MKKFLKNKFLVLIICVMLVSGVYLAVQKAIDNYFFESNDDIVSSDGQISEDEFNLELGEDGDFSNVDNVTETAQVTGDELGMKDEQDIDGAEAEVTQEEDRIDGSATTEKGQDDGTQDSETIAESEEREKIYVYITGEVNVPGVVILDEGSRIVDAINAAGGTTTKADVSKVNLVYVLSDGMKVNIPNSSDLKNNSNFEYITMNSGDDSADDFVADREDKDSDTSGNAGSVSSSTSSNSGSGSQSYSVVNINTATQTELESLPGIGPSLALSIINYRKENGKFSSIEDLKNVSGIGDVRFENLKKYIKV